MAAFQITHQKRKQVKWIVRKPGRRLNVNKL